MLYCFDTDGTLLTEKMKGYGKYVEGIIPTEKLIELEKKDHTVVIVSPSPFLPDRYMDDNHWIVDFGNNEYRWFNVKHAMEIHGFKKEDTVYVDDLKVNRKYLEKEGVKSYSPEEFMRL